METAFISAMTRALIGAQGSSCSYKMQGALELRRLPVLGMRSNL